MNIFDVQKPWGKFRQFTQDEVSTVKLIYLNPNQQLSLQSHQGREEFWVIVKGSGQVTIGEEVFEAKEGDEFVIPKTQKHRAKGGESGMVYLEICTGEFDEEDIVRYQDDYGRESH